MPGLASEGIILRAWHSGQQFVGRFLEHARVRQVSVRMSLIGYLQAGADELATYRRPISQVCEGSRSFAFHEDGEAKQCDRQPLNWPPR